MKKFVTTLFLLLNTICSFSQNKSELSFQLPALPDTLRTVEARFNFVVENYWCNFDFADTAYIDSRVAEEALVNYIDLLCRLPLQKSEQYLNGFLEKTAAEIKMQKYMNNTLRRYLVNYDSPMRNDALYIAAAKYLSSKALDEIDKFNAIQDLNLLTINPVGSIATNFLFTLPNGEEKELKSIESRYTIILFYNPGCRSCSQILEAVKCSESINDSLNKGETTLLALNAHDDSYMWREFISNTPDKWINGYDKGMKLISENIYDLRELPIFYLLDSGGKIMLKDAPFTTIEEFFK